MRIQELSKLEEEPAKKEFEALSVRLEELQKEAQRLQEEMEQEEALRKKRPGAESTGAGKAGTKPGAVSIRAKVRKTGRESSCTVP